MSRRIKRSLLINRMLLISLVHERPAIWDKTNEIYKCKRAKSEAWREICNVLNKDYEKLDPVRRKEYFKNLIRMWTHIRDSWMKSIKDKRNRIELTRPYIYHEQLLFLKKVIGPIGYFGSSENNQEMEQRENSEGEVEERDSELPSASDYPMDDQIDDNQRELSKKTLKINRLQLINLVRERPAIWDRTSEIYKNRLAKADCWHDICINMNEYYEQMNQRRRKQFYKILISKWNQIRDSWMRSIKNRSARPYRHHEKLIFLKKILNIPDPFESNGNEEVNELEVSIEAETESVGTNCSSVKRKVYDEERDNSHFVDLEIKNTPSQMIKEDRHYSFFKSIQPTLALFNDDQVLEFQAGTIRLLQKIKSQHSFAEYQYRTVINGDSQDAPSPINQDPIKVESYLIN